MRALAPLLQRIYDWREVNITATGTIRPTAAWIGLGTLVSYETQNLSQKEREKKEEEEKGMAMGGGGRVLDRRAEGVPNFPGTHIYICA